MKPVSTRSGLRPVSRWLISGNTSAIPPEDFAFADCRAGNVTHVYRMEDKYEHVLINSQYQGVAMVIVVDLQSQSIYGHMLLDLNPAGTKEPEA